MKHTFQPTAILWIGIMLGALLVATGIGATVHSHYGSPAGSMSGIISWLMIVSALVHIFDRHASENISNMMGAATWSSGLIELPEKPSTGWSLAPAWANYLATDDDGCTWAYREKPIWVEECGGWSPVNEDALCELIDQGCSPLITGNGINTLRTRPEIPLTLAEDSATRLSEELQALRTDFQALTGAHAETLVANLDLKKALDTQKTITANLRRQVTNLKKQLPTPKPAAKPKAAKKKMRNAA